LKALLEETLGQNLQRRRWRISPGAAVASAGRPDWLACPLSRAETNHSHRRSVSGNERTRRSGSCWP